MSSVVLTGDTSGAGTITVPAVAGTFTATMGSATGTHFPFTAGTAVASTSGTSIDFTSIPSWVKRITVMLSGVSTNGSSLMRFQLGDSGGIETTGYVGVCNQIGGAAAAAASTSGFDSYGDNGASNTRHGTLVFTLLGSNTWTLLGAYNIVSAFQYVFTGTKTLSDTLTQVRVTTVNGTDTFDAGSINILYE
jgi:hypothetical protein